MNDAPHPEPPRPAQSEAEANTYVRNIVARSGTSFRWGMRILPAPRREAMYAIYAFCRAVDDIADGPEPTDQRLAALDRWRAEIDDLYAGRTRIPVTTALRRPVADYGLPREEFLAIIDGMEMDAREAMHGPSPQDYTLYCRRVAGAVGRLSIHAFGDTSPAAMELAVVLGEALQTTNVLRDLAEDAARGRLYLPGDVLAAHGIAGRTPDAILAHPALPQVCADMAGRARSGFIEARALLQQCNRRRMRPAAVMLAVYERVLAHLERRGWERIDQPVRLSRSEKLWAVVRHGLF